MGFTDLFKSSKELEREKRRQRRAAERDAERAVDAVRERIASLKKERDAAWSEARAYLRDGQKSATQRCLQSVQAKEVMMGKLERKNWVFSQLITKMEMSKTDQEFAAALGKLTKAITIDPENIAEVLDETDNVLSGQKDIDKIWDKEYAREMDGLSQTDAVPSVDEMMATLEKEVVADVSGAKSVAGVKNPSASGVLDNVAESIGAGRRRLKEIMDGKK